MKRHLSLSLLLALSLSACPECATPPTPPPPPPPVNQDPLTTALASEARRLTRQEVDRTIRDVLGDDSNGGSRLLPTDTFTPYDNEYTQQQSSATLVDSLDAMSADVAVRVLANPDARARLIPCVPAADDDAACFTQVVNALGKRMLRRPLTPDEVEPIMGLLVFATEESQFYETSFDTAVELAVRAFLMDPEFLFRIEVGAPTEEPGVSHLNPYEIATRMSYALWGSAPDDALLAEADSGALDDAAARSAMAELMLADPKAREQLNRFHAMWLGYRAIPTEPALASLFAQETDALLGRVVFDERRDYLDVFRLDETFVDDTLADHYGLPRPAESPAPGWVSYEGTTRAGILGHGALLASFSKFSDTSPTQRGILVRNRLMCLSIDPPPPNVNADEPPPATEEVVCKAERYAVHTQNESCFACHSQMDPIGFGLENYDIAGRFRTTDDGLPECPIDGVGELPGYGFFSGPRELADKLVDENLIGPCFVKQFASFTHGRPLSNDELALGVADAWHDRFLEGERRFDTLLVEQIAGEQFVTRREPAATGVTP